MMPLEAAKPEEIFVAAELGVSSASPGQAMCKSCHYCPWHAPAGPATPDLILGHMAASHAPQLQVS